MLCSLLRAVQYTGRLHRSSGKRLFLPRFVLHKSCVKAEPTWRCVLGVAPKTIWTQSQSPRRAKEDGSKLVPAHSHRGEPAVSTSQKGNGRPFRTGDEGPSAVLQLSAQEAEQMHTHRRESRSASWRLREPRGYKLLLGLNSGVDVDCDVALLNHVWKISLHFH